MPKLSDVFALREAIGFGGGTRLEPAPMARPQEGTDAKRKWDEEVRRQLDRELDRLRDEMTGEELLRGDLLRRIEAFIADSVETGNRPFFEDVRLELDRRLGR